MKRSAEQFSTTLETIRELLTRDHLVADLTRRQHWPRQTVVEALTRRQRLSKLQYHLMRLHIADVANIMGCLPLPERQQVWDLVAAQRGGEILLELTDSVLAQLIQSMPKKQLSQVLLQLDADKLSFISDFLPPKLLQTRLAALSREDQDWIRTFMQYPDDTVGAYMSREMILVHADHSLKMVQHDLRQHKSLPEQCDKLFVINHQGELVGTLPLETLLFSKPKKLVNCCMSTPVVSFAADEDALRAAAAFERYDLVSAPIVNERNRPIGRLTVDVIMDVVREANTEDALNLAGIHREEDLFAPIRDSTRNRWVWIACSLLTAFLATYVIGLFAETITRYVALAALMPIVVAIGGNTGNQTTTLIVRALALDQINRENIGHLIRKEFCISLLNGLVWGTIVALFALFVYRDPLLAAIIGVAMALTLLLATLFALSIPLSLVHFKRDPALGSSVLVTALTDSIGFFIFLSLATLVLP